MSERSEIVLPNRGIQPAYQDVHRMENSDGIVGVISQRRQNGILTFGIWREYPHFGEIAKTAFFGEHLFESYKAFLNIVGESLVRLGNGEPGSHGPLPFPRRR